MEILTYESMIKDSKLVLIFSIFIFTIILTPVGVIGLFVMSIMCIAKNSQYNKLTKNNNIFLICGILMLIFVIFLFILAPIPGFVLYGSCKIA